ncbi:phosphoribulokinase [Spiribacter pallidus]|jgi:phosphoribulokinase|uniref:phosphoribulokinase n=1 Tax=Spiribacter pallidus TaxID=1987936 RepID=A0ABV3TDF6_9GAMM
MTSDPHDKPAPQAGVNDLPARLRRRRRPIIIGVAGDSGSGKSTYTQGLEWLLGPELVSQVSLDGYHAEDRATRRASGRSPLDPEANHLERAGTDLERLSRGEATRIPIYDHEDGVFRDARVYQPTPIILVEGLHTLYPALRSMLDVAVYVDTATEVKREWKMRRDTRERGYKGAEAEAEIARRAHQYERWIADQEQHAEVILRIHPSELGKLAIGRLSADVPDSFYHLELIVAPGGDDQRSLFLPVDLNSMTREQAMPFMLAIVPSQYQARTVNVLHVDGHMAPAGLETLTQSICAFAGLDAPAGGSGIEWPATVRFAQMLVAWPVINRISAIAAGD